MLEEVEVVKVTVDRREKTLQEYAGAASVVSQQDLDKMGVRSVRELSSSVPYAEIGTQEGNTEVFIRGIGSNNNTELGDPAVALYMDNVYIPRPRGVGSMFFDLERTEINRGPQGTLRGRNAVGGSMNLVSVQPKLREWEAGASVQMGNYSQRVTRGMVNVPVGEKMALRLATYTEVHDPFFKNAGPISTLVPSESADSMAYRASLKWVPVERLKIVVRNDWAQERGTGITGSNFTPAFNAGVKASEVPDPRALIFRGPQGNQNLHHWGVSLDATLDLGPVLVGYLGSYRDLDYNQVVGGNAGVAFNGYRPNLDDWTAGYWHTASQSWTQELRLFAPDSARLRWSAGGFFFDEQQQTNLFGTLDQAQPVDGSSGFGYEYNMPDMKSRAYAGFADATYEILKTLRATGGVRWTSEEKSRTGVGNSYGINWGGVTPQTVRFGTEGFLMNDRNRSIYNMGDGSVVPAAPYQGFTDGVARYGVRDNVAQILQQPNIGMTNNWNTQSGTYSDSWADFRVGADADLTKNNLAYVMFSTGHHSGGFNDNIRVVENGQPVRSVAPEYKPETLYATEIGLKNQFLDKRLTANIAAYWYEYRDQQYQVIQALGNGAQSAVRVNAAQSRLLGIDADLTARLPGHITLGAQAMLLNAKFTEGSIVDARIAGSTDPYNLEGNTLPRAPLLSLNYSISQTIPTSIGFFDWTVGAQTKTDYYMSVYNGEGKDTKGNVNPALDDKQSGFTRVDAGIGYTRRDGKTRIDAFANNITDAIYMTSLNSSPYNHWRYYNAPRQFAVRLSLSF